MKKELPLFVFQRHVASQNVSIFNAFRHIGMTGAVIQDQATNKLRIQFCFVLHFHNLNHMQINWFA